ncbi:MAG: hypothetical protein WAO83_07565 [Fuerstiella sp.]
MMNQRPFSVLTNAIYQMPSIDAGRPIPQTTDVEVASGGNAVNDHLHAASLQFIVMTSATSVQRIPATSSDFHGNESHRPRSGNNALQQMIAARLQIRNQQASSESSM